MSDLGEFEEVLDEAARESDISREEALKRAIVALAEANDVDVPGIEEISELESRLDAVEDAAGMSAEDAAGMSAEDGTPDGSGALREDVDDLREEVKALREDVDEKIRDLRSRVVRIYRETESKAPAEHDHPELTSAVEDLRTTVEELRAATDDSGAEAGDVNELDATVDELGATVDELDATVGDVADRLADLEAGSEALADRLESMESAVEDRGDESDVSEKLSRIASAVVGVQRRLRAVERRTADAEALTRLTATANREGIRKATCEHCGDPVRISLLSKPRCPHCDREFSRLEPKSGFFGTSRLAVGDPPALEGQVADSGSDAPTDRTTADGSGKR